MTNSTDEKMISWCEHGKMLVCEICALKTEVKNLKQQVETLKDALEDVADYQHRWSDSPIFEVQKIARKALQSINKQ